MAFPSKQFITQVGFARDGFASNLMISLQENGITGEKLDEMMPLVHALADVIGRNNRRIAKDIDRALKEITAKG